MKKQIVILTLVLCLGGVGASYAYWSDGLNVQAEITTGNFDMVFQNGDEYSAAIVDENDTIVSAVEDLGIELVNDGKEADLTVDGELPVDQLVNCYLRIQFPLEKSESGDLAAEGTGELDLEQPVQTVELESKNMNVELNDIQYELQSETELFSQPLVFNVYQKIDADAEQTTATIYLKLTDESAAMIQEFLSQPFELSASQLENYEQQTNQVTESGNLLVNYRCEIPIYLDQLQ